MLISKKILNQLIPYINKISNEKLAKKFNELAIEVESVFNFSTTKGLKFGKIIKVEKHFNADNVQVCEVQIKSKKSQIVCGAKTLNVGANVIVAQGNIQMLDGRIIGTKDFRGIESEGMMCDYYELSGVKNNLSHLDEDEIIELSSDEIKSASCVSDVINLDDTIFDVSIASNRNDLSGLIGIANELNAFYNQKNIIFKSDLNKKYKKLNFKSLINEDFIALKIDDIDHKKTNWRTKSLLMNSGVKPLNTIEDIVAISTIISGVPFIGVEAQNIESITIEELKEPKVVNVVNFGKLKLHKKDVVYVSKKKIIAVAGIGPVEEFKIKNSSKKVIFLATKIDEVAFRKTILRLKIMSNSIKFFQKKISSFYFEQAINNLFNTLSVKYKNLAVAKEIKENKNVTFKIDYDFINQILGSSFSKTEICNFLKRFGIEIKNNHVLIPSSRIDLSNNFDLAEEILKLNSINEIKPQIINQTSIRINNINNYEWIENLSNKFASKGFYQIRNYNLVSKSLVEQYNWYGYEPIKILNPISIEREYLKLSLLPSLIECYGYNSSYKNELLPIFEIQKIYHKKGSNFHFCLMFPSKLYSNILTKNQTLSDIHLAKDMLTTIENEFRIKFDYRKNEILKYTADNNAVDVYFNNKKIGYLGQMCPNTIKNYKINDSIVYLGEINLSMLLDIKKPELTFKEFNNTHLIIKELTFLIDNVDEIENLYKIIEVAPNLANYKTIDYFVKETKIAISIQFEIINVKQNEVKLAFNDIIKFFKQNEITIPK